MADDKLKKIKDILGGDDKSNVSNEYNVASTGLNLDNSVNQVAKGQLTYALNAAVENFDSSSVNYQNEQGNEFCLQFPSGYQLIGKHAIIEKNKHIFFLSNPLTQSSEIGFMDNNDCIYHKLVNAPCLNFDITHPIQKVVHKISNCTTEIYWTDGFNSRRYLDIENLPYTLQPGTDLCDPKYTDELDCNQLLLQPNFTIPELNISDVVSGGALKAGVYQFAIQYSDASGNPFTSYYSVTNPTPIADIQLTTVNFNYEVGKSIVVSISNLDITGQFQYYNLAVIKTINNIPSVELIGTYYIEQTSEKITYSGQNVTQIQLSIEDIFEKYPYYEIAQDVTAVQDVLVWDQLTSIDRINYQSIASQISLLWETYKIPATENYSDELNATNLRGYLRDEIYAFEIVFLLKNGKQTDGFHIPGRVKNNNENYADIPSTNFDFVGNPDYINGGTGYSAYWKIYNTASVIGPATGNPIGNATPYQYGEFAYWESDQDYPCNTELWGDLAGQKIRHHKFPDVLVSPIIESALFTDSSGMVMQNDAVYPIGVKIDHYQIASLITASNLTPEQIKNIIGYKIVRGNRDVNKSIVGKGILRNVGEYVKEEQTFYYPNYPYNDLNEDPFLLTRNNAYEVLGQSEVWMVTALLDNTSYNYTNPDSGKLKKVENMKKGEVHEFCSLSRPVYLTGQALIGPANYDAYTVFRGGVYPQDPFDARALIRWSNNNDSTTILSGGRFGTYEGYLPWYAFYLDVGKKPYMLHNGEPIPDADLCQQPNILCDIGQFPPNQPGCYYSGYVINGKYLGRRSKVSCQLAKPLPPFKSTYSYKQIFNSPETSFGQPFLGNVLKLENVMFGRGRAHFVPVKDNAKYRLLSREAQTDALTSSKDIAALGSINAGAMFTVYQSYLTIYINGITRKNYANSYNSIANYDYTSDIENDIGIKQRQIEYSQYLIPTVQSVADLKGIALNNWNRESSVFIKTIEKNLNTPYDPIPFPSETPSMIVGGVPKVTDKSRLTISGSGLCDNPAKEQAISVVSYYASMKNLFPGQWGQIYSYDTIDTGFQRMLISNSTQDVVFGGDTFISRFAFKTKLPFFIDNRVKAPDDSDIFYDEIGNVAYPTYWHSARSLLESVQVGGVLMTNLVSYKAHNFDCPNDPASIPIPKTEGVATGTLRTFYDGYFYLFAYGVPNFYCESSYNTNLRQAFNNKEGDFWPHVSTSIPDDWVQESFVSIANDNTYTYNVTFSKQNKENTFTHLPPDWDPASCYTHYPFRAIYSDSQEQNADNRVNNWLSYSPTSLFDFPQNYGNLVSLDGVQNRAILARFENKSLLYNNLLTMDTSNPQAAYLGNPSLFSAIPIDFAETDLGYVGSQNKFLLKIPNGQITIDAKRGQVFLIAGTQIEDLSSFGSGMNRFFTDHLAFEILRYFPTVNIDNNYSGVGLHGVYDSKFERIIITKLDYIPVDKTVKYDSVKQEFYIETLFNSVPVRTQVYLTDSDYFCNKSWTVSFNFNTKSWISFHSYLPNFYVGENNFFYSGLNACCDDFNFVALAGPVVVGTTTTTTTDSPRPPATTTTTTIYIDCNLEGNVITTNCTLEGEAVITVPPTTTTTVCVRPIYLDPYEFYTGYQIGAGPIIDSTGSLLDVCSAISNTLNNPIATITYITFSAIELTIGQTVYLNSINTDCTLVPDGWYFTLDSQIAGFAYHVVGGVIIAITPCSALTTTTTTTSIPCLAFTASTTSEAVETLIYVDCSGTTQTITMGSGVPPFSEDFCCRSVTSYTSGITLTYNGTCLLL